MNAITVRLEPWEMDLGHHIGAESVAACAARGMGAGNWRNEDPEEEGRARGYSHALEIAVGKYLGRFVHLGVWAQHTSAPPNRPDVSPDLEVRRIDDLRNPWVVVKPRDVDRGYRIVVGHIEKEPDGGGKATLLGYVPARLAMEKTYRDHPTYRQGSGVRVAPISIVRPVSRLKAILDGQEVPA